MKMKLDGSEKIIARVDTPQFEKYPLFSISIGGSGKWFGYNRGDNYGTISICGVYFSFRLPYQPNIVFGQGVDAGFNAATKTISYLISKVNTQSVMIAQLTELLQEAANEEEDDEEDDEDDNGFNPQWN
jgi:hypothetical protein